MSTETNGTTEGSTPKQQSFTKQATVVAYVAPEFEEHRDWLDQFGREDVNWFETEEKVSHDRHLVLPSGKEVSLKKSEYKELEGTDLGDAKLVENRETYTNYVNSAIINFDPLIKNLIERFLSQVDGYEKNVWGRKAEGVDGDGYVKVYRYTDNLPLLKEPTELTEEEMEEEEIYVDEDQEFVCFKFRVKAKNVTPDIIEVMNEHVLKPFVFELNDMDGIQCVRSMDCKVEEREEGVCFNI